MRTEWVAKRKADKVRTQMHYARKGMVTEEMEYVARREKLAPERLLEGRPGGDGQGGEGVEPLLFGWRGMQRWIWV